ncbi:MAG: hypothetical protein AAF690_11695 [Acidobacteriota bacterium]
MSSVLSLLIATSLLFVSTPGGRTLDEVELHPKIEKALDLLGQGRVARADKLFAKLLAEEPDQLFEVRLAQARFANDHDDPGAARTAAEEALGVGEEPRSQLARAELLVARAALGELDGVEAELGKLRTLLDRRDGPTADAVRVDLCRVRELLADEHPESLRFARLPTEGVKYLPRVEEGSADMAVKPQQIQDREAIPRGEDAKKLQGKVTARIQGTIDADGCFAKARVGSGVDPVFAPLALDAVRGWVYRPPRLNGRPVGLFFSSVLTYDSGDPNRPVY